MPSIHKLASVDSGAEIGTDVEIGPFAVIEKGAVIGDRCKIAAHAFISSWSRLGSDITIHTGAVVGSDPQDLKFGGEESTFEIGDHTTIREFTTLNRGTHASGKTVIGKNCLVMAYAHIAHDCRVGDNAILVNSVNLAGHVEVGDWAIISASVPVHQFVRVGAHTYIGGLYRVPQDIPPFIRAAGEPLSYKGVNAIGLERRGFSAESVKWIQRAYRIFYRSKLNVTQALQRMNDELEKTPEVQSIIEFIEARGERGIMK
ncbi:acyl-ACP--UDP-N-acetylglucosamine O-acyltransferase [bacterium]|nr:acyl-ACP--UDP-N-acetylglucosamine O-acyltransferase [bacterium]